MITVRWAALFTIGVCVAGLWVTQTHNGLVVIGLLALGAFLWTFGVFTREFWVKDIPADDPAGVGEWDRLDRPDCDCPAAHEEDAA